MRLLQPFQRLLASYEPFPAELPVPEEMREQLKTNDPATRISLEEAHTLLSFAVDASQDLDLGLKAGRLFDLEDGGALAYAASSAPTLRDAMTTASRALHLVTDAVRYRIVPKGARTEVHLESKAPLSRAVADFQASALRSHHLRTHPYDIPSIAWSFTHPEPASLLEYQRTFGAATLHFSSRYLGFSIDTADLELPLRTADERQHQYMRRLLDAALADTKQPATVLRCVREAIARELGNGELAVEQVANTLHMSARTLARRLHEEGTSFRELVSDARKDRALQYLAASDRPIAEIANVLGFSDVAAFYRAFRRWMRTTPVAFRAEARAQRRASAAAAVAADGHGV
ncbi:MAG TPA: AraC family transcriptional regulator ligand-binding domain-containing protein [Polyangiales bacterium]